MDLWLIGGGGGPSAMGIYVHSAIYESYWVCARAQSLVHGQPLEIIISQHVDAKQLSHRPKGLQQ